LRRIKKGIKLTFSNKSEDQMHNLTNIERRRFTIFAKNNYMISLNEKIG